MRARISTFFLFGCAGLFGAAGVGLLALASHAYENTGLQSAASVMLIHAPAILAIAMGRNQTMVRRGPATFSAIGMVIGVLLFSGNIAWKVIMGTQHAPLAPLGGTLLMGSWLLLTLSAWPKR